MEKKSIRLSNDEWITVEQSGPFPKISHNTKKKPSWKVYGEGRAITDITVQPDGSLYMRCVEIALAREPNGRDVTKEVYVQFHPEAVKLLLQALKERGITAD